MTPKGFCFCTIFSRQNVSFNSFPSLPSRFIFTILSYHLMVPTLSNTEFYSNQGMDWRDSSNYPSTPTDDLLGFDAVSTPHQQQPLQTANQSRLQQQPQQQVFNASQATISITAMNTVAAPSIAGLGKIEPSSARNSSSEGQQIKMKRKVIYVPTYSCNGGLDTKVSCVEYLQNCRNYFG